MTEIRFYHLMTRSVDQALPEILQKALSGGRKIVVRTPDAAEAERLNAHLWVFNADSFIPHGTTKDGHAAQQPVWLTDGPDNPNGADVLIVTGGTVPESFDEYALFCDLFDGRDETQVQSARVRWKTYKESAHSLTYWQQTEKGWEQKA